MRLTPSTGTGTQPTEYNTDDLPTISEKAEKALTAGAKRAKKQEKEVSRKRKEKEARGRKKAKLIERAARRKRGDLRLAMSRPRAAALVDIAVTKHEAFWNDHWR